MTVSIFDVLATLPSGTRGQPLTWDELGQYLSKYCNNDPDKKHNADHALRDELYRDGGVRFMERLIDLTFRDQTVRELRKAWVPYARFNNAIRRVVHELSTVYSEHARRMVSDETNSNYQEVLERVHMHERALEISRLLNLHRALLVGFRVRKLPDDTREPVLDVVTPAGFRPVLHPNDNTLVVGWLIRTSYRSVRKSALPEWTLWTDHESVQLRADMTPIVDTYIVHGLGVCPFVPIVLGAPSPGFWPGSEGEDLVAAHIAIWFNNVLLLKESKSANKQAILQGDGTRTARGQAADSEVPSEVGEGQTVTTIDTSMDLSLFRDTTDHVLSHAGLNYGLPPSVLTHQGVQSAEARELQRLPLKELRRQQQIPLRRFERELAIVMAAVLRYDLPALTFDPVEWRMEFAESETPLDPLKEHDLFEKRRSAALDNTIAFYQRLRPGLSVDQAKAEIEENITNETWRNTVMRPLQAISGSLGAEAPGGFGIGDAVTVKPGKEHDPSHKGMVMTVAEIRGDTYALKMPNGAIHRWYTADELMPAGAPSMSNIAPMAQPSTFAVGDRVKIKPGKAHDPSHAKMVMTIAEVRGETYALKMPDGMIHRWYTADELLPAASRPGGAGMSGM